LRAGVSSSSKVAGGGEKQAIRGRLWLNRKIVFVPTKVEWAAPGHEGRSGIFKSRRGLVTGGKHRYQPGIDSWRQEPLDTF